MDFDEYDYLEQMVDVSKPQKAKETANGADETVKSEEKEHRSSKHRLSEKVDDDNGDRSKRSKPADESRDHDRDHDRRKERNSRHSRHRSRSRDADTDRHRSSRESRDRDRERDRNKEERSVRNRDGDRDRHRDRRERDRDVEKETERSHGRRSLSERPPSDQDEKESGKSRDKESRDEKESGKSRDKESRDEKERGKSREKEFRERGGEKELRERDREIRRQKKEDRIEPEADPERDQRTVFAYQISLKANERDVYEFFSRAGKVRDVRLIMDRNSRRSKGVGYIEFYDVMSVPMAIAISGQPLLGQPVMVKPSEAEKNLVQSTISGAGGSGGLTGAYTGGARRLYVGNLHSSMTEDDLRKVFEPFGTVELVQLPPDGSGLCKGFGFVQFARLEDARNALNLNGQLEIGGRTIKVSAVTDQTGMQDAGANAADFDDDEGLALNAHSRAMLMHKLDRSGNESSVPGSLANPVFNASGVPLPPPQLLGAVSAVSPLLAPLGPQGTGLQFPSVIPTIDTIGNPSECLLLKNMFDPSVETQPEFELDIMEDVQDECSKFGKLKHIFVDRNSSGFVYLRFENTQSAIEAQRSLHGRWFAGKMITATFMEPFDYEQKFPDANIDP